MDGQGFLRQNHFVSTYQYITEGGLRERSSLLCIPKTNQLKSNLNLFTEQFCQASYNPRALVLSFSLFLESASVLFHTCLLSCLLAQPPEYMKTSRVAHGVSGALNLTLAVLSCIPILTSLCFLTWSFPPLWADPHPELAQTIMWMLVGLFCPLQKFLLPTLPFCQTEKGCPHSHAVSPLPPQSATPSL